MDVGVEAKLVEHERLISLNSSSKMDSFLILRRERSISSSLEERDESRETEFDVPSPSTLALLEREPPDGNSLMESVEDVEPPCRQPFANSSCCSSIAS